MTWQPTASINNLKLRAVLLAKIRNFFAEKEVLEVETPLLSQATVTDLYLQSFKTQYYLDNQQQQTLYLQTSPEFAMKRLLAAGSGPIYQICKSFRNHGEAGRFHNPEFTMLEWYCPGFNHYDLMNEMDELLKTVLSTDTAERLTYKELFKKYVGLDPHKTSIENLKQKAKELGLNIDNLNLSAEDNYLHLLMTHIIEPNLGLNNRPTFVYNFPASQAALARLSNDNPPIAERFEVYINGIELANGFHELSDAREQHQRFVNDLQKRKNENYPQLPIDENLIAALTHGLPDCAGVALGIDRLMMIALNANSIGEILSFTIKNA